MNFKRNILLITFSLIVCCDGVNDITENCLINYVIKYIKQNPRFRLITIHNRTPEKLSSTSMRFIQRIVNEFPTLAINTSELSSAPNSHRLKGVKRWLYLRSQRKSLNILFIDGVPEKNIEKVLVEHIKFLVNFSLKTTRPHCIFFLINSKNDTRLKEFFQFSWSRHFLDVVVIELVKPVMPKNNLFASPIDDYTVTFQHFNPFNNTYFKKTLLEKEREKLFIDKLNNLHGYLLKTGLFDEIPMVMLDRNYPGNDVWGMAWGLDVAITKTLEKKLNFTASVKVINSDNPNVRRFNISKDYMDRALKYENIDFAVNFFGMVGSKPLEDMVFESSIFLYPFSSNLIVKQNGKPVIKLSQNLMIITSVIVVTIIAFSIVIRLLHLDTKIWTPYNMTKILIGSSVSANPRKVYERILFLSLTVISSALSVNILEQLLDVYLWQDLFADLETIQDVVNAGIVPSISRNTKRGISSYNHSALQKILRYSTTIEKEELVANCIEQLINYKSVNGCEVDSILGKLVSKSFSDKERGWIISFVQEPIVQRCWTAMILTKTSPYIGRFNQILRRFLDSGLVSFWYHSSLRNFTFMNKNFFGDEPLQYHSNPRLFNRNYFVKSQKTSLNKRIILILVIGHAISCLVFVGEFILGHYQGRSTKHKVKKTFGALFNYTN